MSQNQLVTRLEAWKQYVWAASNNPGVAHRQIVFKFPNGYGASVIPDFTSPQLVELAVLHFSVEDGQEAFHLDYDTPVSNDVERLDYDELFTTLDAIRSLPDYVDPSIPQIDVSDSSI